MTEPGEIANFAVYPGFLVGEKVGIHHKEISNLN